MFFQMQVGHGVQLASFSFMTGRVPEREPGGLCRVRMDHSETSLRREEESERTWNPRRGPWNRFECPFRKSDLHFTSWWCGCFLESCGGLSHARPDMQAMHHKPITPAAILHMLKTGQELGRMLGIIALLLLLVLLPGFATDLSPRPS